MARQLRNSCPTAPVTPAMATFGRLRPFFLYAARAAPEVDRRRTLSRGSAEEAAAATDGDDDDDASSVRADSDSDMADCSGGREWGREGGERGVYVLIGAVGK